MNESLYEYILKEQKKTVNNPNWNNFVKKLKVGDKTTVFHMREQSCTIQKVINIKPFGKSIDIELDNGKSYRDGIEIYEIYSKYSSASEHLIELTQELDDLLRDEYIRKHRVVRLRNTNWDELSNEKINRAYLLISNIFDKDVETSEGKTDRIVEVYNDLTDIEKQEFKSIVRFDDESARLVELLKEVKKLEKAIVNNV